MRQFIAYNLLVIFICAMIYHKVQGFNKPMNFQEAVYFSTITHTTVGYGDFYPESSKARALCACHSLAMFLVTATWALKKN
jgi:hypothetical protein